MFLVPREKIRDTARARVLKYGPQGDRNASTERLVVAGCGALPLESFPNVLRPSSFDWPEQCKSSAEYPPLGDLGHKIQMADLR